MNLRAVRRDGLVAADAIAWFRPVAGGHTIGYALGADAATWLRVRAADDIEHHHNRDPVATAYELVLFDGERELRWLRTPDGLGIAVALGEHITALPAGDDVTMWWPRADGIGRAPGDDRARQAPRRGPTQCRLLAERPRAHSTAGWSLLDSSRYHATPVPCECGPGELLAIETVEYLIEDRYGNVDVADTRTVGLRPQSIDQVAREANPAVRPAWGSMS